MGYKEEHSVQQGRKGGEKYLREKEKHRATEQEFWGLEGEMLSLIGILKKMQRALVWWAVPATPGLLQDLLRNKVGNGEEGEEETFLPCHQS